MKTNGHDSLGFLLHDAARLMRKRFEHRATELGLSSAQWRLLVHLNRLGSATQARLAERLEIEPISVSRLIDRMAEAGWVRREADPSDRRSKLVVPTEKATATWNDVKSMAALVYDEALSGLTEAERAALMSGLGAMVRNLSHEAKDER